MFGDSAFIPAHTCPPHTCTYVVPLTFSHIYLGRYTHTHTHCIREIIISDEKEEGKEGGTSAARLSY